jgi:uroporphyrinogen-III synthase
VSREALVLRPEPGNARTSDALRQAGWIAHCLPLFEVMALPWAVPDPTRYDALLLTSANAVRHGGSGLDQLRTLPVVAVGQATAAAARDARFRVTIVGSSGVTAAVAAAGSMKRLLHLGGRHHVSVPGVDALAVYTSEAVAVPAGALAGYDAPTALLHSVRAAERLEHLAARDGVARSAWCIAALSPAIAKAAGEGWGRIQVAQKPSDAALLALLRRDGRAD